MPSAAMERIRKRNLPQPEARPPETDANTETAERQNEVTHAPPETKTPTLTEQSTTPVSPTEDQPEISQPDQSADDPETIDYHSKFKRLSGKVSGLEKSKNEAEKQAQQEREEREAAEQRYQALLDQLNTQSSKPSETSSPSVHESTETMPDFEAELKAEYGEEEWEWLEDGERRKQIANAKRLYKIFQDNQPKPTEPDKLDIPNVTEEIDKAFAERDRAAKQQRFLGELDKVTDALGEGSFGELVNQTDFESWINGSRRRVSRFNDATKYQDEEAIEDVRELISEYLKETKVEPQSSPDIRQPKATESIKKTVITPEQYRQAVHDMGIASRRKKARAVIAAYEKQQT